MERLYSHMPLSVCDLNTKFNDKCSADWSQTNLISLVTLDGIYLLRPQLELPHGPFQIELIRNPQLKFRHQCARHDWTRFDKLWPYLDNQQYMEIYLDPALMTNVDSVSHDFYPRRYRLARWSPPTRTYPRQCLLAALTTDYQLLVFARDRGAWIAKLDVSHEYDKLWCQLNPPATTAVELPRPTKQQQQQQHLRQEQEEFLRISRDLHSMSICNLCWTETEQQRKLILLSATIPGDIILWHLNTQGNPQSQPTAHLGQPLSNELILNVEMIIRTNLEYISSMQLFESLLIASARDGQVVLYDFSPYLKNLDSPANPPPTATTLDCNQPTAVRTINMMIVQPSATIWHKDYIEVSDFYLQPISKETFRIVLAKSTNICWCNINYTKQPDKDFATLQISHSFSAIDGLDPDVSLHQTPATSLKPAGHRRAVLIADDGSFFQLEFMDDLEESSPEFNAIRTGKVDLSRMVPRGLCTSPNQVLVAMISGISLIYEPTKILAPAKLLLLPLQTDRQFFLDCFQKLTSQEWLQSNQINSPMEVCDRIDYIRSLYSTFNADAAREYKQALVEIMQEPEKPQNVAQLTRLKIASFLFMKLVKMKLSFLYDDLASDWDFYSRRCDNILICELEQILNLSSISASKRDELSTSQINSLRNFLQWLDLTRNIDPTSKSVWMDKLSFVKEFADSAEHPIESCPICAATIELDSLKLATCTNQHAFVRCSRSLLLLQLQSTGGLSCEHCERSYMTHQLWPTTNSWLCLYCQ